MDHIVVGFWWAFARALQWRRDCGNSTESQNSVHSFRTLCVMVAFDYKLSPTEDAVLLDTFQSIEDIEELRSQHGFTGFRKILLVNWAMETLKQKDATKTPSNSSTACFLRTQLRWHDPKRVPTELVVRDLRILGEKLLKIRVLCPPSKKRKPAGVATLSSMNIQNCW